MSLSADLPALHGRLRGNLAPMPGRLRGTLEITGLCLLVTALCMAWRVPEAALSCYLIFFAHRDNAGDMILNAIKLVMAASLGIVLAVPLLGFVVDSPMARLAAIALFTFLGMYLSQASALGPMAATAGFVFAFALTLYDVIPVPEVLTRALTWMWVVVTLPMLCMALWAVAGGVSPQARVRQVIAARRAACADPHGAQAARLLDDGMERTDTLLRLARLTGGAGAARALARPADESYRQLALARAGVAPAARGAPPRTLPPPGKPALLQPDIATNPDYHRFAIKVLIAVLATYGLYTAGGLFEIHTAMITCFYVALGTQAETVHKMTLRLVGCVMGVVAGALVLRFAMPHLTDLGHLLLIVGLGCLPAAWLAVGPERISYAGWQMALCYFLVVLGGFGPQTDLAAATDRLLGILIGATVVWAVFASLWPAPAAEKVEDAVARMDAGLAVMPAPRSGRDLAALRAPLAEASRLADLRAYERASVPLACLTRAEARLNAHLRAAFVPAPKETPHA